MAQQHGNKVKRIALLTPEQDARLVAMAQREERSASNMIAVLIDRATKEEKRDRKKE